MSRKKLYGDFCTVPNCGGTHRAHGYCNRHYIQHKRHGQILTDEVVEFMRIKLMERRMSLGLTIGQLAERADMNAIRYGQFERGNLDVSRKQRDRINKALEDRRLELLQQHREMVKKLDAMNALTFEEFEYYGSEEEWK